MRSSGKACGSSGKKKEERVRETARYHPNKSGLPSEKIRQSPPQLPVRDVSDPSVAILPEHRRSPPDGHIDWVSGRISNGEKIPEREKTYSVFEPYAERIRQGRLRRSVESGKKANITACRYPPIA
jgi:hypothetical protein